MEDVAAEQAELPLQIERRQYLPADARWPRSPARMVDRRDHEIGDLVTMVVP